MNFNKSGNSLVKFSIILIFLIVLFVIFSKPLFGDDRTFPVKNSLNQKMMVDGYEIEITDSKYDSRHKIVAFDLEWYVEEFSFNNNDEYKREYALYYADPKQEIKDYEVFYTTELKTYKVSETEEKRKIVFHVQVPIKANIKDKLGLVFQIKINKKVWDEQAQESHYELYNKYNIGLDYRDMKFTNLEPITSKEIDNASKEYFEYLKLQNDSSDITYTLEGEPLLEEDGSLSKESQLQSIDNVIAILEDQKTMLEEEILQIQANIETLDYTEEQKEIQEEIIKNKEKEIEEIDERIKYYKGLKEDINNPDKEDSTKDDNEEEDSVDDESQSNEDDDSLEDVIDNIIPDSETNNSDNNTISDDTTTDDNSDSVSGLAGGDTPTSSDDTPTSSDDTTSDAGSSLGQSGLGDSGSASNGNAINAA